MAGCLALVAVASLQAGPLQESDVADFRDHSAAGRFLLSMLLGTIAALAVGAVIGARLLQANTALRRRLRERMARETRATPPSPHWRDEAALRAALARGEFEMYFQPLVQVKPRRIAGFEVLLRWNHPTLGVIMPASFIPAAEAVGVIADIGTWVLHAACAEAAGWPAGLHIAVNLSPMQFERADVVEVVARALRDSGLDPARLELEITEGVVMSNRDESRDTIRRLQALGVRIALDDFGTGYSSLSYLRSFPFDKVKIDGSFLDDLQGDGGTIVRAVLALCRRLGREALVEGVEREDQLMWLHAAGCTEVQGHLFSEPRPAACVAEMIAGLTPA